MSQALTQFLALSIGIAAALAVVLQILKTNEELREARKFNLKLQGENDSLSLRVVSQRAEEKRLRGKATALTKALDATLMVLQEIEERTALPLRGLTDEDLVEVIREELINRVEHRCLVEYAFGPSDDPIWKIASKVGGAAFRVVDKAKRGTLSVQG